MYVTYQDVQRYQSDGFVIVKDVFTRQEVDTMLDAVEHGDRVAKSVFTDRDSAGRPSKSAYWEDLTGDIWSAASTCPRIVNTIRILLGQEASFFHGKVMLKEAHSGGAWEWHQDYGYWYWGGFLFPHMMSAFVALDPCTRENGCLRVLKGSHELGRLDHMRIGTQEGISPERIRHIENRFETVECEMSPGSVLFFHCNLLHASQPNTSDHHRRAFIMCYTATANQQIVDGHIIQRDPCPVGSDNLL